MAPPLADTPLRPPPPLRPPLRRARPLRRGDRIALVAPSRPADPERVRASISYLEGRGYRVRVGEHICDTHHYLAGSDRDRAADLDGGDLGSLGAGGGRVATPLANAEERTRTSTP